RRLRRPRRPVRPRRRVRGRGERRRRRHRLRTRDGDDLLAGAHPRRGAARAPAARRRAAQRGAPGHRDGGTRLLRRARRARHLHPAGDLAAALRGDARRRHRHRPARRRRGRRLRAARANCRAHRGRAGHAQCGPTDGRTLMTPLRTPRRLAALAAAALLLAACGSGDPLAEPGPTTDGATASGEGTDGPAGTVVVGSQAYYSNEIVAEIYAQVLEDAGFDVERQFQIGQRDVYLAAMENGEVQLLPEYTGNLLQFYDADTEARSSEDVAAALPDALPESLTV